MKIKNKEFNKELVVNKIYRGFQREFYGQVNLINKKYIADFIQELETGTIYLKIIESKLTHHR